MLQIPQYEWVTKILTYGNLYRIELDPLDVPPGTWVVFYGVHKIGMASSIDDAKNIAEEHHQQNWEIMQRPAGPPTTEDLRRMQAYRSYRDLPH
jgi:hypothetical protein